MFALISAIAALLLEKVRKDALENSDGTGQ